jgi:type IV fimbrial biogenesis protein FimT
MAMRNFRTGQGRRSVALAAGVTIIELLVVVSITAVLAAVAAPAMRDVMAAQRVRSVASSLHLTLVKARSEAIKRNRAITIQPVDDGWEDGWKIVDPDDPAGPGEQVKVSPSARVTIAATPSDLGQMVYNGSGRTTLAAESTFLISTPDTSFARCVLVDYGGRAYVKEGSVC